MQNLISVAVFALWLSVAYGSTPQLSNSYMDKVINQHLISEINNRRLDPTFLSNFKTEFKHNIKLINVNVKTDYEKGSLAGLSRVSRLGNCGAPFWANFGTNATLNCTLAFDGLEVSYIGKTKYGIVPSFTINANANVTRTTVQVVISSPRNRNTPRVTSASVISIEQVRSTFTGLGPLNSALNGLADTFADQVSEQIKLAVNSGFKQALEAVAPKVTMPYPR